MSKSVVLFVYIIAKISHGLVPYINRKVKAPTPIGQVPCSQHLLLLVKSPAHSTYSYWSSHLLIAPIPFGHVPCPQHLLLLVKSPAPSTCLQLVRSPAPNFCLRLVKSPAHTLQVLAKSKMTSELIRLASYINFPYDRIHIFCTELAHCGYVYTGISTVIECEACRARVRIQENWELTHYKLRHARGCVFDGNSQDPTSELNKDETVTTTDIGASHDFYEERNDLKPDSCIESKQLMTQSLSSFDDSNYIKSHLSTSHQNDTLYLNNLLPTTTTEHNKEKQDLAASSSVNITSETANYLTIGAVEFFDFPDLFIPEYFGFNSSNDLSHSSSSGRDCVKNPGHFAYFTLSSLRMEQIPSTFRCSEMLKLLNVMGDLTVRIIGSSTSSRRQLRHSTTVNQFQRKTGTGFIIEYPCRGKPPSQKSKFTSIRKMLPIWKQASVNYVYIQTSRHVVYDDGEAQKTVVEILLDGHERKTVSLEGKFVLGSEVPGDNQCLLVCECTDSGFIQRLNELQQEFYQLAERLPLKVKKGLLKKLFMVHHPHGGPKVLSYGDFVRIKYKYCAGSDISQPVLTKLNNQEPVLSDGTSYRKSLYYAADTCPGSCGAPVLTFTHRSGDTSGVSSLHVDLWMHNGVETTHKLGVSVLKACTAADLLPRPDGPENGHLTMPEDDSEDEDSLGKQKPESLASSGFYYTEVADCVRCFQCGLRLRSWKPGDDVITEHKKHGPSCPYLHLLLNGVARDSAEAMAASDITSQSGENMMVTLLEKENREWRRQLTCKICFKSDVKDVFLPCGELYACSECSKLLTHCPSCNKPILATVTVYMT
ncbi:hypothetical protein Btru_024585 [Bulinus truncatus]|nr:hypothetical protein Btru_024585 [Bulinus truncatus]